MLWPFVVLINPQFGKHWLSAGAISFPVSLLPLQYNEFKELEATLPVRMMKFYCIRGGPWCPQNQTSLREDMAGVAWMLEVSEEGTPSCMHRSVWALWSVLSGLVAGLGASWVSQRFFLWSIFTARPDSGSEILHPRMGPNYCWPTS